jgi:hypothetical protein
MATPKKPASKQPNPVSNRKNQVTSNIPSMMPGERKKDLRVRIDDKIVKTIRTLTPLRDAPKRAVKTEPTRSEMTAIENRRMMPISKTKKKK